MYDYFISHLEVFGYERHMYAIHVHNAYGICIPHESLFASPLIIMDHHSHFKLQICDCAFPIYDTLFNNWVESPHLCDRFACYSCRKSMSILITGPRQCIKTSRDILSKVYDRQLLLFSRSYPFSWWLISQIAPKAFFFQIGNHTGQYPACNYWNYCSVLLSWAFTEGEWL